MKEKVQKIEKLQITGNQKKKRATKKETSAELIDLAGHLRNISTEGGSIVLSAVFMRF